MVEFVQMASLSGLFTSLQKGFLKNVLEGAGLTLGTGAISLFLLDQAIQAMKSNFNNLSVTILQLAGLCGFDVAISITLGAIVTRYVQKSGSLSLQKLR